MIWSFIQQTGFIIFLSLTIYFVLKREYTNLLILYFAGIVFSSFNVYFLTIWTPEKIASLGMIYCICFRRREYRINVPRRLKSILIILFVLIFVSNITGFLSTPRYQYLIQPLQRQILSTVSYLTSSIIIIYGILLPVDFKKEFFPKYCRIMELAILTGLIHYIFLKVGIEFMPINRSGLVPDTLGGEVIAEFGGSIVRRIYAFAGEPKGLAFCILPYLIISITLLFQNTFISNKRHHITFLLLGLFIFYNTFSSSAFINFIFMIPLVLVLGRLKPNFTLMSICVMSLIMLLFFGLSSDNGISSFIDNVNQRTFERGQTELANDRQESVIMENFENEDWPTKILGWGMGQYTFQVPGQVFNKSILIPVQSGLVLTIADFGLCGILFFFYIVYFVLTVVFNSKKINSPIIIAFSLATLSKVIESMMHGNLTTSFVYIMVSCFMLIYEKSYARI